MGCAQSTEEAPGLAQEKKQAKEIDHLIDVEDKKEKKIQKLLLLGAGESGKSTIFKQVKVLYQSGFSIEEKAGFKSLVWENVYQSMKILLDGRQEFSEEEDAGSEYNLLPENVDLATKFDEIGSRSHSDLPDLSPQLASEVKRLWQDLAIKSTYDRANELQLPDCAGFFLSNVERLAAANYIPTEEDILYARVRTTGIAETEFSPDAKSKTVYRLFDVGGQRNERRKWMHLFDGVTAVIFCAALSEYDQVLFEDETVNRMIETKNLFEWVLKQPWFRETSVLLFLNKYDLFEKKLEKTPLNVCKWFQDYQPQGSGAAKVEHAYKYVERKFEQVFQANNPPGNIKKRFAVYKTTATDSKVVDNIFQLVKEVLTFQLIDTALI